jgi:lysophospholipase L1-like esterase
MQPAYKRAARIISVPIYVFVIGEVILRVLSSFVLFFNVEMVDYAAKLLSESPVPNVTHRQTPNASARIMGVDLRLNSLGHRSIELLPVKPEGEYRIHFIGSSITLGWGVPVDDSFAEITAARLTGERRNGDSATFVAINAGTADYNTVYSVRTFKSQAPRTDPDLVVVQYHLNDARPDPQGGASPILRYSFFAAFLYQEIKSLGFLAGRSLAETYADVYREDQSNWERTQEALRDLKQFADARGIAVVAILIPELHDLTPDTAFAPIYGAVERRFADIGIPLINPFPELADAFGGDVAAAMVATGDPHPSAAAHRIIAEKLFAFLTSRPDLTRLD